LKVVLTPAIAEADQLNDPIAATAAITAARRIP
jgi:hypothetical protein